MRRIKIINNDEIGLYFPKNVNTDKICLLLNVLYPEMNYKEEYIEDRLYIVSESTLLHNIKRIAGKFTPKALLLRAHFEITDYKDNSEELYLLKDLRIVESLNIEDPYNLILYQFFGDVIFDLFEFLPSKEYKTYYEAILALIEADYLTAALKFGLIGELFCQITLKDHIVKKLKRSEDISKIRELVSKKSDWSGLIDTLKSINQYCQDLSQEKKESLDAMFHAFHFLRILRNRAHHLNKKFMESQAEIMLSLLIHLQEELREFLRDQK